MGEFPGQVKLVWDALGSSGAVLRSFGGACVAGGPVLQPMTPDPARPPGTEDPPYILKSPINRKADIMLGSEGYQRDY